MTRALRKTTHFVTYTLHVYTGSLIIEYRLFLYGKLRIRGKNSLIEKSLKLCFSYKNMIRTMLNFRPLDAAMLFL